MSVIVQNEKIESVMKSLILDYQGRRDISRAVLTYEEEHRLNMFGPSTEKEQINNIMCWCNRLFWANQLAYMCTYQDADRKLLDLDEHSKARPHGGRKTLYRDLMSIRYNLCSNSGRVFLSKDDMEKFDNLCTIVADRIITAEDNDMSQCGNID
jgi:hypothetical protein